MNKWNAAGEGRYECGVCGSHGDITRDCTVCGSVALVHQVSVGGMTDTWQDVKREDYPHYVGDKRIVKWKVE